MNFGTTFINMIRVLYKNPTAVVLIGKTCSPAFAILKRFKTRLPPELFTLSLEPLAQAIRCLPTFSSISNKGTHQNIFLYAHNVLLYIENPVQCVPRILSFFKQYGKLSGFKINWQKSVLLPLSHKMCNAPISASIPVTKNVLYLEINISSSIQTITPPVLPPASILEQTTICDNEIPLARQTSKCGTQMCCYSIMMD